MAKRYLKGLVLAIGFCLAFGVSHAQTKAVRSTTGQAAAELEAYFNAMTTLQANFTQTQSDKPREVQKGTFKANRPKGQFVWQYVTPIRQRVIGTGTTVYYIDQSARVGDGQVTQLPLDAGMGRLLRGGKLDLRAMKLQVTGVQALPQGQRITLTPSAGAGSVANQGLKQLEVTFARTGNTKQLAGFAATDALGVTMRISLTDVKTGVVIPASTFAYTPPQQRVR